MNWNRLLGLIVIWLLLGGCYPDSSISPEESDAVFTFRDKDFDFSEQAYYYLVDSVLRYNNEGEYVEDKGQYDNLILSRVKENLDARGFISKEEYDSTSLRVLVSDMSAVSIISYWEYIPYWSYYYCDEVSYPYCPWQAPTAVSFVSQSNILVDIVCPEVSIKNDTINVAWRGITNGIYNSSMEARLKRNIDQMFYQSPYLIFK